ncbi:hypothetical protein LR48_Vigan03g080700 [Vigna angularis]|uniref:Uncharacterized protein n=1 Tax=Phaseolus angularis TaxID=3914 RepID=A0A0L9U3Q4_PHAAN|nr:hypothetical protein LR48_Vigan03g080700 [Vigna angularis]
MGVDLIWRLALAIQFRVSIWGLATLWEAQLRLRWRRLAVDLAFVGDGPTRARFCLQYGMRAGVMRRGERRHHGGSHGSFGDPTGSTEGEEEIVCQAIVAKILG